MRNFLVLAVLALCACDGPSTPDAGSPRDAGVDSGPAGYDGGPITRIPESAAAAMRASCAFERGAFPWRTIGEEHPIGNDIPIDHFILLMQENRSFDHYFGTMPGVDGTQSGASNPDGAGGDVPAFHASEYCVADPHHSWNASHAQWNNGANDGFVTSNNPNGRRAMGYLDDSDLPFYWNLAQTFAMSDQHHCSLLGPTWVNRYYYLSATSFGYIDNVPVEEARTPTDGEHIILQQLDRQGVSWRIYYDKAPFVFGGYPYYAFVNTANRARILSIENFFVDLDSGNLPQVSYVDPTWDWDSGVDATDEHPHANPQRGQAWVREIVTRVMASPLWPRTAIILTYDEHGGFYDHVPPPAACPPGDYSPQLGASDVPGEFDRLGFRVPLMVISPYSRPAYVSDHPQATDHTSILRLLQARYLMPAMTARDANAWPLLDMFDFTTPAFLTPPPLADAVVDPAHVQACCIAFPRPEGIECGVL